MQEGIVKWFDSTKGYGFIRPEEAKSDVFIHISQVEKAGFTTLEKGEPVEFSITEDQFGRKRAENIIVYEYV